MCLPEHAEWSIEIITSLQLVACDLELTPIFYGANNSKSLFFRFECYSEKLSMLQWDEQDEYQKKAVQTYQFLRNCRTFWWRIEEWEIDSITEFLYQHDAVVKCFMALDIKVKDHSDRIYDLHNTLQDLKNKQQEDLCKVKVVEKTVEKIVGISRNDVIIIYELAAQCCSAYNNLIMLIDKKNASKYVAYAKGTAKQSQYTQDIAEAKYWTDKIKSFTKPMADFCESMNELYEQTQGIQGKYGNWDSQRPYGKAEDFPFLTQAYIHLEHLVKHTYNLPKILNESNAEYKKHLKYMANRQRVY